MKIFINVKVCVAYLVSYLVSTETKQHSNTEEIGYWSVGQNILFSGLEQKKKKDILRFIF